MKSMSSIKRDVLLKLLALLAMAFLLRPPLADVLTAAEDRDVNSITLYFLNGIVVYDSSTNETLILETPANLTLRDGFKQGVTSLLSYNLNFNETVKAFTFNATKGYVGFFVCRVEVRARPMNQALTLIEQALKDPVFTPKPSSSEVPGEVREYLREPHPKVIESVKPEYEKWFRETYRQGVDGAGPLGIAATAAYFVYFCYMEYDPSGIPRSIEQAVEARRGDCDDMSRILVELLNAYGIPAVMVDGYTYIRGFNLTQPIENVTYKYVNGGPHAFVMAYVPGDGWISLDLLALSLLGSPFVFEGYSRETAVEGEVVEEILNLHRSINATQIFMLMSEGEFKELLGEPMTLEKVMRLFQQIAGIEETTATAPQVEEVVATRSEVWYVVAIVAVLALTAIVSAVLIKSRSAKGLASRARKLINVFS